MSASSIPYIDPNVEHVGVSRLRKLNAANLRQNQKALVIQENDKPLAVLLTYEQFLSMQKQIQSVMATIEVLTDEEERVSLAAGLRNLRAGKTKPLEDIRAELKKA
ncbi:MAG: hypothetical protein HY238_16965 [Acidobacteria bacterium]|nr:hypothetical protein [Acidobacteriota bacterium]